MKKKIIIIVAVIVALLLAAGVGAIFLLGGSNDTPTSNDKEPPVITGVQDLLCAAGETIDLMQGVEAYDETDGDLTDAVEIDIMPVLPVTDGTVTPDAAGEYEIIYYVADAAGNSQEAYATLRVSKALEEMEVYKAFDFTDTSLAYIKSEFKNGSQGKLTVRDDFALLDITKGSVDNNCWDTRLVITTGQNLLPGKSYRVSLDVYSLNGHDFEICYNRSDVEKDFGATYGIVMDENEQRTFTQYITPNEAGNLVIALQVGTLRTVQGPAFIKISNLVIEEVDSNTAAKPLTFCEGGFGIYNEPNEGAGEMSIVDGSLIYNMTKIGLVDWHNKLFVDGVRLEADKMYTIRFSAKADREIAAIFFLNVCGKWEPRVTQEVTFTTEETVYEYKVPEAFIVAMDFELLWQFGSEVNNQLGNAKVEFSDICIFSQDFSNEAVESSDSTAPVISGVEDLSCYIGNSVDLLQNVTAKDDVDGELSEIEVSLSPAVEVQEGKVSGLAQGYYWVTYTATDRAGNKQEEYAVLEVAPILGKEYDYKTFTFAEDVAYVSTRFDAGAQGKLQVNDQGATLMIEKGPETNNIWETKLIINTGMKLVKGKTYKISLDVYSLNGHEFELLFNRDSVEKAFGEMYGQMLAPNEQRTFSITTTPQDTGCLSIFLQLGKLEQVQGDAVIRVSNVRVEEIGGPTTALKLEEGGFGINNEASYASGYWYRGNSAMSYCMTKIGNTDWYNKLFVERVTLKADQVYTIAFTALADKEISGQFYVNVCGKWEPLVTKDVTLNGQEKTFEFKISKPLEATTDVELLWQFGSEANSRLGNATVSVSNIQITARRAYKGYLPTEDFEAPVITGVKDMTAYVGVETDLLAGVTATEGNIQLSVMPALEIKNGKATPTEEKNYYITYKATDEAGNVTEENAVLSVVPVLGETVTEYQYNFANTATGFVKADFTTESEGSLKIDGNTATMVISKGPAGNNVWETKLMINTGLKLEVSKTYKISLDVYSLNGQEFEIIFNRDGVEQAYGALFGQMLAPNEQRTFTVTTTPDTAGSLSIFVQLGKLSTPQGEALVRVSNVKVEEVGGKAKTLSFTTGSPAVTNEAEGGAQGSSTIADGKFIYDMTAISATDYHNKLFLEGIQFGANKLYTVKVTAKADKEITAKFFLNEMGTWDPIISRDVTFTTTEQEFVFTMAEALDHDAVMELLWQFGSETNSQLGSARIEISNITVESQKVYQSTATKEDLKAPAISGVKNITANVGQTVNLLKGISATDNVDGAISNIQISVFPALSVKNGKVKPTEEKYHYITYKVTDKAGNVAEKNAVLSVVPVLGETVTEYEYDFANTATGFVKADFTTESEGSLKIDGNTATMLISKGPAGNNVWETKLMINTGLKLDAGKTYKISLDVYSLNGHEFEIIFNRDSVEQAYGALFGQMLAPNEERTFTVTTTPDAAGSLSIFVQLGKLSTPQGEALVQVSNVKVEEVGGEAKTLTFTAGSPAVTNEAAGGAQGSSTIADGKFIYDMTAISATDYHNKLFLEGIQFGANKLYTVKVTAKADKEITAKFFLNEMGTWAPLISRDVTFTTTEQEFVFTMAEALTHDAVMELLWQFGSETNSQLGSARIEISNITVEYQKVYATSDFVEDHTAPEISGVQNITTYVGVETDLLAGITATDNGQPVDVQVSVAPAIAVTDGKITSTQAKNYYVTYTAIDQAGNVAEEYAIVSVEPILGEPVTQQEYDFANTATGFVKADFTTESEGTLKVDGGTATMLISKGPAGNNVWETKLMINTGLKLDAGKTYKISLDVYSLNGHTFEIIFNRDSVEQGYGGLFNQILSPNEEQTYTVTTTPTEEGSLSIFVQLGKLSVPQGEALVQVSNVKVEEVGGEAKTLTFTAGSPAVTNEAAGGAQGSSTIADGKFIYDMTAISATDYHNKLFLESIEFGANKLYTVKVTAKADKEITAKFFLNEMGTWAPLISKDVTFTTTEQEFVFAMSEALDHDAVMELLWQFGSETNSQLGGAKIEISNITVEYQKVYDTADFVEDLEAPVISGVKNITTNVGGEVDLLAGVTATDNGEPVDVQVSVTPDITVTDGKVTATQEKHYYVTYTAIDQAGNVGQAYGILSVVPLLGEPVVYKEYTFGDPNTAYVAPTFEGGSDGLWEVDDKSATLHITQGPSINSNIWETKLTVTTGIKLVKGQQYTVSFDLESANGHTFEILYYSSGDSTGLPQAKGQVLQAGEKKTFTNNLRIRVAGELSIVLQVGTLDDVDKGDVLRLTNLQITKTSGTSESYTPALAAGGYGHVNGNAAAKGTSMTENGKLIYDMTSIGTMPDHNRLFVDGISFKAGMNYIVRFTAKADKEITGNLALQLSSSGGAQVMSKPVTFTTTEEQYEIKLFDDPLDMDLECRLLWLMGSTSNNALRTAKLEISQLQILSQRKYETAVPDEDTVSPVFSGIQDLTCVAGTPLNLLNGVKALDAVDGNLTGQIRVKVETVTGGPLMAVNGNIPVTVAGQYSITYTVSDDAGNKTEQTVQLTVSEG